MDLLLFPKDGKGLPRANMRGKDPGDHTPGLRRQRRGKAGRKNRRSYTWKGAGQKSTQGTPGEDARKSRLAGKRALDRGARRSKGALLPQGERLLRSKTLAKKMSNKGKKIIRTTQKIFEKRAICSKDSCPALGALGAGSQMK